jgi:hypothetical protein
LFRELLRKTNLQSRRKHLEAATPRKQSYCKLGEYNTFESGALRLTKARCVQVRCGAKCGCGRLPKRAE